MAARFERKNIRLAADQYRGQRAYFVTLCFDGRRRFGANARLAAWLIGLMRKHAAACGFLVHAYCIMPDHLHILVQSVADHGNLMKFVEAFKQETAFEFSQRTHRRLWQFKYYDRILRAGDSANRVAWYVWMNPVRKGLCRSVIDYPFAGSFTEWGTTLLKGMAVEEWVPPWKGNTKMPR
jgi:putative transposase